MRYLFRYCLAIGLLAGGCQEQAEKTGKSPGLDLTIEPGKRVGFITGTSTVDEIKEKYGTENVREEEIYIAEGETQRGLTLFPGSPREIEIAMGEEGAPAFIRVSRDRSAWKTPEGITVGTSLDELRRINGKPFSFYGFEWDYGGLVTDWGGGTQNANLIIALVPENYDRLNEEMMGEVVLSSEDPEVKDLGLQVGSLVVTF